MRGGNEGVAVVGVEYDPNPIETWTDLDSSIFCSFLILDEGWMVMVTVVVITRTRNNLNDLHTKPQPKHDPLVVAFKVWQR